jgi:hypothetical protein
MIAYPRSMMPMPALRHMRTNVSSSTTNGIFSNLRQYVKCQPVPTRIYRVDAHAKHFFREDSESMIKVSRWVKTLNWKNASQIQQKPIEDAIRDYGP